MSLVVGTLVRNEANNYWSTWLQDIAQGADAVALFDDASDDETVAMARETLGEKLVYLAELPEPKFETLEWQMRRSLYDACCQLVLQYDPPHWVAILDADEILEVGGWQYLHTELREAPSHVTHIGFRLYDMWNSPWTYRSDGLWNAHTRLWRVIVRANPWAIAWPHAQAHGGRIPLDAGIPAATLASLVRIRHLGWTKPEDRQRKLERYQRQDPGARWGSQQQYDSILDRLPNLVEWDPLPGWEGGQ